MRVRLGLVVLGTVLISSWGVLLHAHPHEPAPSSFLLVASKQMPDPRFHQAVLLVTRHGNSEMVGIIVNRPREATLENVLPDIPEAKKVNLFYGGPIYPEQITYLVRGGETLAGTLQISEHSYLATNLPLLGELLSGKQQHQDIRVMHGMATWYSGQLDYEIKQGGWYVMPLDEDIIFNRPPLEMWQELYIRANSISL